MVEATGSMAEAGGYNHPVLTNEKGVLAVLTNQRPTYLGWSGHGLTPGGNAAGDLAPGACRETMRGVIWLPQASFDCRVVSCTSREK